VRSIRKIWTTATNSTPSLRRRAALPIAAAAVLGAFGGATLLASEAAATHLAASHHRSRARHRHRRAHHRARLRSTAHRNAASTSCTSSDLSLTLSSFMAGMFHYANVYALTNNGTGACTIEGYPTVVTANVPTATASAARAHTRSHRRRRTDATPVPLTVHQADAPPWGESPSPVTIQPGDSAGLIIGYVADPNAPSCPAALTSFKVTLPGTSAPITPDRTSFTVCPGNKLGRDLYVSPILPQPQPVPPAVS
jgi:hypothetical protein